MTATQPTAPPDRTGPLHGVRVLELGGMGPGPFAGMTLADMGADVVRIEKPGGLGVFPGDPTLDVLNRGKRIASLDLKHPDAVAAVLDLAAASDIVLEGSRPGVAERLGIGPDACLARHPALVYGRMTGWGQDGPLSQRAGHDIAYIARTGALHAIGPAGGAPQPPLNLVGDFGGGALYLVAGVLAALLEARTTGVGQVVDAAIVDGAAHLLATVHGFSNTGHWRDERGVNVLDGGAPYYGCYATADGEYMAVGAIEPKFYTLLLDGLGLTDVEVADQDVEATWPATRAAIAAAFAQKSQADWTGVFDGTDACVSPVLGLRAAAEDEHVRHRGAVRHDGDYLEPGPAPHFPRYPERRTTRPHRPGADTRAVLDGFGLDTEALLASGAASEG